MTLLNAYIDGKRFTCTTAINKEGFIEMIREHLGAYYSHEETTGKQKGLHFVTRKPEPLLKKVEQNKYTHVRYGECFFELQKPISDIKEIKRELIALFPELEYGIFYKKEGTTLIIAFGIPTRHNELDMLKW